QPLNNATANGLSAQLSLGQQAGFRSSWSAPTKRGTTTVRMQQMYRGVPIYGRSVAGARDSNGYSVMATGVLSQGLDASIGSVTPRLSATMALDVLQGRSSRSALSASSRRGSATDIRNREASLYVYPEDNGNAR